MSLRTLLLAGLVVLAAACGQEIGDSCTLSTDCSSQGDRICDSNSPGGYCTVIGCDVGTCPDEAVCVRFFPVVSSNRPCDPATEDRTTNECTSDEVCTLSGSCAPRTAEVRFCMRSCESNGDCRDEYECRDQELMELHGGEPVPNPGDPIGSNVGDRFCAAKPRN
jgi:hypothetical protein